MKRGSFAILGLCLGVAVVFLFSRVHKQRKRKGKGGLDMQFEFGETQESHAFLVRNPKFLPMFIRLTELGNRYLGERPLPKNQIEDICFGLGHACRQDFIEVIFLAVNGYGTGASKLTRGLYERSVVLAYLVQNPDKVERFVRCAAIQEHRAMDAALKVVSEIEFDAMMGPLNAVAEIRKRYQEIKPEFEEDLCKKCGTKRVKASWDLDVAAMVHKLGQPYRDFFLPNYTVPNLSIHATLSSATLRTEPDLGGEADLQVLCASFLMLLTLRSQESMFHLGFEKELDACQRDIENLRPQRDEPAA